MYKISIRPTWGVVCSLVTSPEEICDQARKSVEKIHKDVAYIGV